MPSHGFTAPAAQPAPELFLLTFFKDPTGSGQSVGTDDEQYLYLAASGDGKEFSPVSGPLTTAGFRDISLIQRGSKFFITGTTIGADPAQQQIRVTASPDMQPGTWTNVATIDITAARPTAARAWAAEFFEDTDGKVYIIASVMDGASDLVSTSRPYLWRANDDTLTSWTSLGLMNLAGNVPAGGAWTDRSIIDFNVVKIGSTYHLFAKDSTTFRIVHFTATSLLGPWTYDKGVNDEWGWGANVEAPTLVRLSSGKWRIYLDYNVDGELRYAESTNVDDLSAWGATANARVPMNARHPGVIRTTKRSWRDLVLNVALTHGALHAPGQPFFAKMRKTNSTGVIAANTTGKMDFNVKTFDPENAADLTNDRIVCKKQGIHRASAGVMFAGNVPATVGWWTLQIRLYDETGTLQNYSIQSIHHDGDQLCLNLQDEFWVRKPGWYFEAWTINSVATLIRGDSFGDGKNWLTVSCG